MGLICCGVELFWDCLIVRIDYCWVLFVRDCIFVVLICVGLVFLVLHSRGVDVWCEFVRC